MRDNTKEADQIDWLFAACHTTKFHLSIHTTHTHTQAYKFYVDIFSVFFSRKNVRIFMDRGDHATLHFGRIVFLILEFMISHSIKVKCFLLVF